MTIDIVTLDDWEGLYINGKLVDEDHSIRLDTVLKKLAREYKFTFRSRYVSPEFEEKIHEVGNLPENLDEVEF
jgi:hypothetical protein